MNKQIKEVCKTVVGILCVCLCLFACSDDLPINQNPIDTPIEGGDPSIPRPDDSVIPIYDTLLQARKLAEWSVSKRFGKEPVFTDDALEISDGMYGQGNDFIGRPVDLYYTFIAPKDDTLKARPFILLVHEGAFYFGDRTSERDKAISLAKRGFAVAIIDYRLGFHGSTASYTCASNVAELARAVYRSVQDIHLAWNYFYDRREVFGIDNWQFYLGGSSAGAVASASTAYTSLADFEELAPVRKDGMGEIVDRNIRLKMPIRGLLTYLGYSMLDHSVVDTSNALPTVFFQSINDDALPFRKGNLFLCKNYPFVIGAQSASELLEKAGVPYELNYDTTEGHVLTSFSSSYIADRYSLFIKRLWQEDYRQIVNERFKEQSNRLLSMPPLQP